MGIISNAINFGKGFNISSKGPIDSRMIVEKIKDLTTVWNQDAPSYKGMVVSVLEDGNVYVLINDDHKDINNWKKMGSAIGEYSLPIMTEDMRNAALEDANSGFSVDSSYIFIDDGSSLNGETTNNTITSVNGTYLHIIMNTIRALQAEVAKLKNSFEYGIHSYNNGDTAKSSVLNQYDETLSNEALWALDPYSMSEVLNTDVLLIPENFSIINGEGNINATIPNELIFENCTCRFSDKENTLLNLTDSKLVTYLVTDSKKIYFNLHGKYNTHEKRSIDISSLIEGDYNRYGIMIVISRKVGDLGKNYVYISVNNYEENEKIIEGYLTNDNKLAFATGGESTVYEVDYEYSIESIDFVEQTLYRMKFYTKYEDFSEEVIPSIPEEDYAYKASHISIRSVDNNATIEKIKEQLHENELTWNKEKKELSIKSNNELYDIGTVKIISLYQDQYNNIKEYDHNDIYLITYGDTTSSGSGYRDIIEDEKYRTLITNVYSSTYEPTTFDKPDGENSINTCEKLYADILINLNCDAKTLLQQKNKFITISKYSRNKRKYIVLNDEQQQDDRLTMYCWVVKHEENPIYWSYFYTTENFNDDVNELNGNDPLIWTVRNPYPEYRNSTFYNDYNNYATSLNQLISDGSCVSDYYESSVIERCTERDINNWFVTMGTKNPIEKWRNENFPDSEDLDDLIYNKKENFINWIGEKSFVQRGSREDGDLYAFRSYCGDYPIIPVRIADCQLLMTLKLKEKYYGSKDAGVIGDKYISFGELTEEDLILLDEIVLKLPYSTNYIIGRLYAKSNQENYIYRDLNDGIYEDYLGEFDRIGGNKDVNFEKEGCRLTIPIRFGICKAEQVKSGRYKDLPQFSCKIYTERSEFYKYDYEYGEERKIALSKIMYY